MTSEDRRGDSPDPRPRMDGGMSMSFGMSSGGGAGDDRAGGAAARGPEAAMRMDVPQPELQVLPFRIVVVDGFCGDAARPSRPVPVTAAGIDDALQQLAVRVAFEVDNHLASTPKEFAVELRFGRMRDFRPSEIQKQVPQLRAIAALRERLEDLRAGRCAPGDVEARLGDVRGLDALQPALELALGRAPSAGTAAAAAPPPVDEQQRLGRSLLDELLGGASSPVTPPPPPPSPPAGALDGVLSSITSGNRPTPQPNAARALELLDRVVAKQLAAIVQAEPFAAVERAWRSLQVVLTHARGERSPVRVELLHADRDGVLEAMVPAVFEPELEGETEEPVALLVVGWPVANRAAELDELRELWRQAEELQAPLLRSLDPAFVVEGGARAFAGRDSARTLLADASLAKWRSARGDDAARWGAVCCNRFLLRDGDGQQLWGEPAWFVAALIARSVVEHGWPTRFTGTRHGAIAGLPIADGHPVEAALGEAIVEDFAAAGVLALTCVAGRDEALLLRAPTCHEPPQFGSREAANQDSRRRSSLPYQLFAARVVAVTARHRAALLGDGGDAVVGGRVAKFLQALVGGTGPGARVQVELEVDAGDPAMRWVHCSVTAGADVAGGAVVEFSLPAPRP